MKYVGKFKERFPKTTKFSNFMYIQVVFYFFAELCAWTFSYKHICVTYSFCADNLNIIAEDGISDMLAY